MSEDVDVGTNKIFDSTYEDYPVYPILSVNLSPRGISFVFPKRDIFHDKDKIIGVISSRAIRQSKDKLEQERSFIKNNLIDGKYVEIQSQGIWQGFGEVRKWELNPWSGFTFFIEWTDQADEKTDRVAEGFKEQINKEGVKNLKFSA